MADKIRLVRNDTRPQLILTLTDATDGSPIDLSPTGTVVRMKFRQVGAQTLTAVMEATLLPGLLRQDGTVDNSMPWDVPGRGGRCVIQWTQQALAGDAGDYEAEVEITFPDGTVQTVYDLLKFKVRDDFPNA